MYVRYNQLPVEAREKGCRIIYILRNPKDVAVSFFNHHKSFPTSYNQYNGSFEDYLPFYLEGNTDYGSSSRHPIHVLYFEDMKEKAEEEIRKLAEFLKLPTDEELVKSIAEKCSFSNMKRDKAPYHPTHVGTRSVYRKGEVGDWRNWFTVQQSETVDRLVQEKMAGSNFRFRFSL